MGHQNINGLRYAKIFHKDIFLCLIYYVPRSNSNILEIIERDIVDRYNGKGDIMLAGDLNERTGSEPDFIVGDASTHIPVNKDSYNIDSVIGEWASQDTALDSRGRDLLDLCICHQIRILNGRCFGNTTGNYTCFKQNGCSVVDYLLASESLLSKVLYMHVSCFNANFSDCYCKLSVKILASFDKEYENTELQNFPMRYIWNNQSVAQFQKFFSHPGIQNEIKLFLDNKISYEKDSINKATNTIHTIFDKVCKVSEKRKNLYIIKSGLISNCPL